jgi:hypothetical protein
VIVTVVPLGALALGRLIVPDIPAIVGKACAADAAAETPIAAVALVGVGLAPTGTY